MPLKTKPLGNNCLIEVLKDYEGVSRFDENESQSYGRLINANIQRYHVTASTAIRFDNDFMADVKNGLMAFKGKIVRWEQFAEGGQTFEEDGKTYALIPWWRLISVTEE